LKFYKIKGINNQSFAIIYLQQLISCTAAFVSNLGVRNGMPRFKPRKIKTTVMHADRIYVLEKGHIIESGSHETLLNIKGLYYAMWRQQIGEREKSDYVPIT